MTKIIMSILVVCMYINVANSNDLQSSRRAIQAAEQTNVPIANVCDGVTYGDLLRHLMYMDGVEWDTLRSRSVLAYYVTAIGKLRMFRTDSELKNKKIRIHLDNLRLNGVVQMSMDDNSSGRYIKTFTDTELAFIVTTTCGVILADRE